MTIFDSLKYPISEPPTQEEFEALPDDLFNEWVSKTGGDYHLLLKQPARIVKWYINVWFITDEERNDLKLLKQMIKEYEPL